MIDYTIKVFNGMTMKDIFDLCVDVGDCGHCPLLEYCCYCFGGIIPRCDWSFLLEE